MITVNVPPETHATEAVAVSARFAYATIQILAQMIAAARQPAACTRLITQTPAETQTFATELKPARTAHAQRARPLSATTPIPAPTTVVTAQLAANS